MQVAGIVLVAVLLTAGVTYWVARTYLWPRDFEPVRLTQQEQVRLESKLRALGIDPPPPPVSGAPGQTWSNSSAARPGPGRRSRTASSSPRSARAS